MNLLTFFSLFNDEIVNKIHIKKLNYLFIFIIILSIIKLKKKKTKHLIINISSSFTGKKTFSKLHNYRLRF